MMFTSAVGTLSQAQPTPPIASALYNELRSVGLDRKQVYAIREAFLDREDLHITLTSGTIAFTTSVQGRITGAFFEGDGEILLVPPNQAERSSMALFTSAAILEERFSTAFFRFDDDTFVQLHEYLRPTGEAPGFVDRWDAVTRSLADTDALPLLESFTFSPPQNIPAKRIAFLHARLSGVHLGTFDVFVRNNVEDQVMVGQVVFSENGAFFDVWSGFPRKSARGSAPASVQSIRPIRISKYKILARVIPPHELQADATLDCIATEDGPRMLLFELSRYLQVSNVTLDGRRVEFIQNPALAGSALARRGNDVVAVVLPNPLLAGTKLQLRFSYSGAVLSEAGGGLMYVGARGTWYPNRGSAMSDFDLEFRYPTAWTLVATGKRILQDTRATEQVARWVSERPIPLAGFNLGRYVTARADSGKIVVEAYAARGVEKTFPTATMVPPPTIFVRPGGPENPNPAPLPNAEFQPSPPSPVIEARGLAERTVRTLDFFSQRFGPYPYSSLALTQMPGKASQGWPELVFLSSYAFLDPRQQTELHLSDFERIAFRELMPAHEAAHQWWGDLITWSNYRDLWLSEALANYSALLMIEANAPVKFRNLMQHYREQLLRPEKTGRPLMDAGPVTFGSRLTSSHFPYGHEVILYGRGAWLLHMLRSIVSDPTPYRSIRMKPGAKKSGARPDHVDEPFYRALRSLTEQFAGRSMSTGDVKKVFERELPASAQYEGKKSLTWFFDGWVNGTAIPRLRLSHLKIWQKNGTTFASGKVLQEEAPAALVTLVPLYAEAGNREVYVGRIFADEKETSFHLEVPAGTRKLTIDPFDTVLKRP